jgi:DNA primase large subunit
VEQCIKNNLPLDDVDDFNIFNTEYVQNILTQRQIDNASHYILLLLCCDDSQMRNWFVKNELILFKIRLLNLKEKKENFIKSLNLKLKRANEQEYFELSQKRSFYTNFPSFFFKVPFEIVTELVKNRQIIINKGFAFLHPDDIDHVVCYYFKKNLISNLTLIERSKKFMEEEFEYIIPLLNNLKGKCQYNSESWRENRLYNINNVTHKDVEKLSKYFPPCMNFLFKKLKQNHHLKYSGRMEFGLFLKCGVGLSMSESLLFWKKAFEPNIDEYLFQKNYAYNIRHNYGREGSRINYTSYNCHQIQTYSEPKYSDHYHGCPFKHFSQTNLINYLKEYIDQYSNQDQNQDKNQNQNQNQDNGNPSYSSSSSSSVNNTVPHSIFKILNMVNNRNYNQACSYLFHCLHSKGQSSPTTDIDQMEIFDNPDKFFLYNYSYYSNNN